MSAVLGLWQKCHSYKCGCCARSDLEYSPGTKFTEYCKLGNVWWYIINGVDNDSLNTGDKKKDKAKDSKPG